MKNFAVTFAAVVAAATFVGWLNQPVNVLQNRAECIRTIGLSCAWAATRR